MSAPDNLKNLLGLRPSSDILSNQIALLSSLVSTSDAAVPEVKSYPDAVYFNYFKLGLSLLFVPVNGYKPKTGLTKTDLSEDKLVLDNIDVYNNPVVTEKNSSKREFSPYPVSPLSITLPIDENNSSPTIFGVLPETTGREFVERLGEPDRKGGGQGPSSGSIGIWCEWSSHGVMVEFGGNEARGPQAWELGKDAVWKVISIFAPKLVN